MRTEQDIKILIEALRKFHAEMNNRDTYKAILTEGKIKALYWVLEGDASEENLLFNTFNKKTNSRLK